MGSYTSMFLFENLSNTISTCLYVFIYFIYVFCFQIDNGLTINWQWKGEEGDEARTSGGLF